VREGRKGRKRREELALNAAKGREQLSP
jgi:hypothetical protein